MFQFDRRTANPLFDDGDSDESGGDESATGPRTKRGSVAKLLEDDERARHANNLDEEAHREWVKQRKEQERIKELEARQKVLLNPSDLLAQFRCSALEAGNLGAGDGARTACFRLS